MFGQKVTEVNTPDGGFGYKPSRRAHSHVARAEKFGFRQTHVSNRQKNVTTGPISRVDRQHFLTTPIDGISKLLLIRALLHAHRCQRIGLRSLSSSDLF